MLFLSVHSDSVFTFPFDGEHDFSHDLLFLQFQFFCGLFIAIFRRSKANGTDVFIIVFKCMRLGLRERDL